jgi:hypothetical protein
MEGNCLEQIRRSDLSDVFRDFTKDLVVTLVANLRPLISRWGVASYRDRTLTWLKMRLRTSSGI